MPGDKVSVNVPLPGYYSGALIEQVLDSLGFEKDVINFLGHEKLNGVVLEIEWEGPTEDFPTIEDACKALERLAKSLIVNLPVLN